MKLSEHYSEKDEINLKKELGLEDSIVKNAAQSVLDLVKKKKIKGNTEIENKIGEEQKKITTRSTNGPKIIARIEDISNNEYHDIKRYFNEEEEFLRKLSENINFL